MNRSYIIFLLSTWFSLSSLFGQEPVDHLKKRISLDLKETELKAALPKIGEAGSFQFSYNSSIIPGDSLVRIEVSDQKVEDILADLLGSDIRYKVLGNHIILLPEANRKSSKNERKIQYTLTGYIYDAFTGEIISQASIYDVDERLVSSTNHEGFYSLNLPSNQDQRLISYSKSGYNDTVIVIRPKDIASINIQLVPKPVVPEEQVLKGLPQVALHDRTLVAALVPGKAMTASENIPVIEERPFQISFLPFLGSNHVVSGLITNKVSINVLAGYSEGVRGLELGSLLNIARNDVSGVQVGGFGNIVGKDTRGVQLAGFFNVNGGSYTGLQVAGFSNLVMDTIRGVQLAGFSNALRGPMYGPQISGFANFTSQNVDGVQISGFTNVAFGDVKVAQVTGFVNVGLKDVKLAQTAGFANVAVGDVRAAQLSGFANYCKNVRGVQASGFTNIASGESKGIQVSGFLNYATNLSGLQVAPFNICDTVSSGMPIGVLSFVRKGYHTLEFTTDELFRANISFKTGVRRFYNILTAGLNEDWVHAGYGLGTQLGFSERWKMSLDISSSLVLNQQFPLERYYLHIKFSPKIDFRLFKFLTLTAGPSLNMFGDIDVTSSEYYSPSLLFSYPVGGYQKENSEILTWIGGSVGIRF